MFILTRAFQILISSQTGISARKDIWSQNYKCGDKVLNNDIYELIDIEL